MLELKCHLTLHHSLTIPKKFAASGLTVRSTIERPVGSAQWLDEFGDFIQIVVLQNYLFFGNASSILTYIESMFEDPDCDDPLALPPLPEFLILDMTLVTGMDTSTVSIISDILNLCDKNGCKLFLSGTSSHIRSVLSYAGVKPMGGERKKRMLRFFNSLDTAIGKAEDLLLETEQQKKPPSMRKLLAVGEESGFRIALRCIDEQVRLICSQPPMTLSSFCLSMEHDLNGLCLVDIHMIM